MHRPLVPIPYPTSRCHKLNWGLFGDGRSVRLPHTNDLFPFVQQFWVELPFGKLGTYRPSLETTSTCLFQNGTVAHNKYHMSFHVTTNGRLLIQTGFMRANGGKLEATVLQR